MPQFKKVDHFDKQFMFEAIQEQVCIWCEHESSTDCGIGHSDCNVGADVMKLAEALEQSNGKG